MGNGPYRFLRYLPQTMMEFEANPDYYRGNPRIEFRADAPVTLLFPKVDFDFVHRRIRELNSPWRADPVEFMEYLWLEDRSDR